jgi:ribonuclease HI
MDDEYVGAGLAWKAQENERNWEGFNGKSYQLGSKKEVYDAELFGIATAIRNATQRLDTDTQRITVFTDSQAALQPQDIPTTPESGYEERD